MTNPIENRACPARALCESLALKLDGLMTNFNILTDSDLPDTPEGLAQPNPVDQVLGVSALAAATMRQEMLTQFAGLVELGREACDGNCPLGAVIQQEQAE